MADPATAVVEKPASDTTAPTEPQPSTQAGPFTVDQVKAWAESKQAPAAPTEEQPFTVDQVKQWAERGTGPLETSPVLQKPAWWEQLALGVLNPVTAGLLGPVGSDYNTNLGRILASQGFHSVAEMIAGLPRIGAAALSPYTDQSVDEVRAHRAELQNQLDDVDKQFEAASKGGALNGEQAASLAQAGALIEHQIKDADVYIASGGQSETPARSVAQGLSSLSNLIEKGGQGGQAGAGEVPVQTQATPVGQVAATAGEIAPQLAIGMAGGAIGGILGHAVQLSAFAAQTFESQHQEAIEHGADERTANLAGLIGMAGIPGQMVAAEVPRLLLSEAISRLLANRTVREGLTDLGRVLVSGVSGGAGMGSYQFAQNVAARVSGYDPNRPQDQGVWQQAIAGAILDSAATTGGLVAGRALRPRAEVEVRTKPGTPAPSPAEAATAAEPATGAATSAAAGVPAPTAAQRLPEEQIQYAPASPEQAAQGLGAELEKALGTPPAQTAAQVGPDLARVLSQSPAEATQEINRSLPSGATTPTIAPAPAAAPETAELTSQPAATIPSPVLEPVAAVPEATRPVGPVQERVQGAATMLPSEVRPTGPAPTDPSVMQRIWSAYQEISEARGRRSVDIRDVIDRAGVPLEEGRAAIAAHPRIQLDEGDWSYATDRERQGAVINRGRPRLFMAMDEPPGAPVAVGPGPTQARILSAYETLRAQGQPDAVAISDLQKQTGLSLGAIHDWLLGNRASIGLHEGDWASASAEDRAAALSVNGNKNLLVDLSDLSKGRQEGTEGQGLARLAGPSAAEARLPETGPLSQREVKRVTNQSASQSGLDGKVSYVPNEQSLPKRIKAALLRQGHTPGSAQTVWDRTLRQLWVVGDAFQNRAELHRALVEETIPRAFEGLRFPVATVHDENDPRLGWWNTQSERATLNTAALGQRPQPLVDGSKTAVHEAVVHGGFTQLFAGSDEGRSTYVAAMREVRRYFDSTGMSQELARNRGYSGLEDMTQDYAKQYGKSGAQLQHLMTEELLAAYAEEKFPTRTSLEQAPRWYQTVLGELGSQIRRAFGWKVGDWDVQQLIRDSYAAIRPGKAPLGIGAIPIRSTAIRPDEHAMAVLDVHRTTDYARANVGQLDLGRPLSTEEADRLHDLLEGAGHPIGIINRPDGPVFVNYGEDRLANHDFQTLVGMDTERVIGPGHTIEFARNEGTYASNHSDTITRSNQIGLGRRTLEPDQRVAIEHGRELSPAVAEGAPGEARPAVSATAGPGPAAPGETRPTGPTGGAGGRAAEETRALGVSRSAGAESAGTIAADRARALAAERATAAERSADAAAPRETYERASIGAGGDLRGPEPRPEHERGERAPIGGAAGAEPGPRPGESLGEIVERAALRGGSDMGGPDRPDEEVPFRASLKNRTGWSAKDVEATSGEKLPYETRSHEQALNEAVDRFRNELGSDIYRAQRYMEANPQLYGTDQGAAMRRVISEAFDRRAQDLRDQGFAQQAVELNHSKELWLRDEAVKETSLGQALSAQKLLYTDGNSAIARWQAQLAKAQRQNGRLGGSIDGAKSVDAAYQRLSDSQRAAVDRLLAQAEPEIGRAQKQIDQTLEERYRHATTDAVNEAFGRLGFKRTPDDQAMLDKLYQNWESTITQMVKERAGELPARPPALKISAQETIRNAISNVPLFERAWTEAVEKLKLDNPNALFFQRLDRALDAPFSQAQIRGFMREQGINLRDLVRQHYSEINRTGQTLYQKLVEGTGLSEEQALRVQQGFDKYFGSAVSAERERQVQEILARAAPDAEKPLPQSEVARILKLMNLGLFDKDEHYNTLAKMLGIESWDRQKLQEMKNAGSMIQQLLAEAGPRDLVNKYMARITDLMLDQAPTNRKGAQEAQSLWMASLLTGPFTHGSYYGQNLLENMFNLAFNTVGKPGIGITDFPRIYSTYARSLMESAARDLPYSLATGTPMHLVAGMETAAGLPRALPFRSRLESAGPGAGPFEGPLKGPLAYLNAYKYVGRFLSGMETVFRNGARDSVTQALGLRLGEARGLSKEDSIRLANELVYGLDDVRTRATQQAEADAARYQLTPLEKARRIEELIDQEVQAKYPELADQAERYAARATYRNAPYGMLGKWTAFLNDLRYDHPIASSIFSPFVNLPANVANAMMNYSPWGIVRGLRAESLYKDVPGIEWNKLPKQEQEDIKWEFIGKGIVGTSVYGAGVLYLMNQLTNANPWFNIHAEGPTNVDERKQWRAGGALPYSLKVGDRYYSYVNTPIRLPLALMGGLGDYLRYDAKVTNPLQLGTTSATQNWVWDLANAEAKAGIGSIMHDNFLQGMSTLLTLLSAPEGHESQQQIQNFAATLTSSAALVPFGGTGTRQILRFFNPTVYEGKGLVGEAVRSIPVANSLFLQPKLNVLGEPIAASPLARLDIPLAGGQAQSQDPVWRYIVDHNVKLSFPTSASVNGRKLDPDEFYEFIKLRGQALKPLLAAQIQDPDFRAMNEEDRDRIVKELENEAKEQAKAYLHLKTVPPTAPNTPLRGRGAYPPGTSSTMPGNTNSIGAPVRLAENAEAEPNPGEWMRYA